MQATSCVDSVSLQELRMGCREGDGAWEEGLTDAVRREMPGVIQCIVECASEHLPRFSSTHLAESSHDHRDRLVLVRELGVDDVIATGSTVGELARVVRRAGAERIEVWAVARAGA